jgi:hypothetical protein
VFNASFNIISVFVIYRHDITEIMLKETLNTLIPPRFVIYRHDITEIMLKEALNTLIPPRFVIYRHDITEIMLKEGENKNKKTICVFKWTGVVRFSVHAKMSGAWPLRLIT